MAVTVVGTLDDDVALLKYFSSVYGIHLSSVESMFFS